MSNLSLDCLCGIDQVTQLDHEIRANRVEFVHAFPQLGQSLTVIPSAGGRAISVMQIRQQADP